MDNIMIFCCGSCLKGDRDREYYDVLQLTSKKPTTDEIKRAYKKISLSLHPDKLAQRGIEVTPEKRQEFLLVKEAYDVLSDPKRRKRYDKLGKTGLKLLESPQELNPMELLKNFQRNRGARWTLMLTIALIFAAIVILPILFALKCDETLGRSAPWVAIWTPMWIMDLFFLMMAFMLFTQQADDDDDDEDAEAGGGEHRDNSPEARAARKAAAKIPMSTKILNLVTTCLFILIQIFILGKLDHSFDFSWAATFAPWIFYEGINALASAPSSFATIPPPNPEETINPEDPSSPTSDEQEALLHQLTQQGKYYEALIERSQKRHSLWNSLLRIWLAVFLSVKLDNRVDWNWGLVLLPIWVYIFSALVVSVQLRGFGKEVLGNVSADDTPTTPNEQLRQQTYQGVNGLATTINLSQCILIFMSILLVCRLQVHSATYSTFIIILPVFIGIGCCCCCVFSAFCCSMMVDPEEAMRQAGGDGAGTGLNPRHATRGYGDEGNAAGGDADVETGGGAAYVAPAFIIPAPSTDDNNKNNNNHNNNPVSSGNIEIVIDGDADKNKNAPSPLRGATSVTATAVPSSAAPVASSATVAEDINEID